MKRVLLCGVLVTVVLVVAAAASGSTGTNTICSAFVKPKPGNPCYTSSGGCPYHSPASGPNRRGA